MGLYDGVATPGRTASTAAVAHAIGWPVVLVVDAASAAQTVAAVAHGLAHFPGHPRIAGAIVNRVASPRHRAMIAAGFARIDLPLLGMVPLDDRLVLPSRHLGLVQAREIADAEARIEAMADVVADACDVPAIAASADGLAGTGALPAIRP